MAQQTRVVERMTWYIPEDLALYNWSLDWRVPFSASLIYAIVVTYFSRRNIRRAAANPAPATKTTKKQEWTLFRVAVVAHNILLTVFSGYTFYSVFPLLLASFRFRPCYDSFCDVGGWAYRHGLGFWTWIFYMSKYYELIDTAILLAKGRPSSFLQTYHHAGAIIAMWMLSSTRAFGAWVFVCFNSFIHTFMYFYYTLTCFGYQPKWKRLMTYMQLTQFFVGLPLAVSYLLVPGCVPIQAHPKDNLAHVLGINGYWSHVVSLAFSFSYVFYLIILFLDFARRTYFSGRQSVAKPGPAKKIN
ncbi:Elongation of fatty acids protein [Paramicrosporidium saccamoebae]|uniref:Elongation of fatty acids protein n=1 Tax=Paramicrosporidium saccamoebae TaxID=1246581 RepID=A0A2H9TH79_9FUNG|nr:Elongation of fatty acids protein [Paramicrosporidium saccamoebae]